MNDYSFSLKSIWTFFINNFITNFESIDAAISLALTGEVSNFKESKILIFLINNAIGQSQNDNNVDEEGFFLTSHDRIELRTGVPEHISSKVLKHLKENGVIDITYKGSVRKALRIKLNVEVIETFLKLAVSLWNERIEEAEEKREVILKERKASYKKNQKRWKDINSQSDLSVEYLTSKGIDEVTSNIMVTVSNSYKVDRDETFKWNEGSFNTLRKYLSGYDKSEYDKQTENLRYINLNLLKEAVKLSNIEKYADRACRDKTDNIFTMITTYKNMRDPSIYKSIPRMEIINTSYEDNTYRRAAFRR